MKKRFTILLAVMLALLLNIPQVLAQATTPALTLYGLETGIDATKWQDMTGATSLTMTGSDDSKYTAVTNIGFSFSFGGADYTQFSANSDGNLRLGSTVTGTSAYSTPFSTSNAKTNAPKINFFGNDGKMGTDGYVKYKLVGTTPNQICVVEFATKKFSNSTVDDAIWQVQLYETTNEVVVVYAPTAPTSTSIPTSFQIGMSGNTAGTDVITVNTSSNTVVTGATSTTNAAAAWPAPNRYYRFYVPTCFKPTAVQSANVAVNSADFTWTAGASETSWQYLCIPTGTTPDWTNATTVTTTAASVSGLRANTVYDFYVRAVCSATDMSDGASTSFRTLCDILSIDEDNPYSYDFEDATTGTSGLIPCYDKYNDAPSTSSYRYYPYANSGASSAHSGTQYASFYQYNYSTAPNNQVLILPQLANEVASLRLRFWAKKGSTTAGVGVLQVGVMDDPADLSTFVQVGSDIALTTTYAQYEVMMNSYEGSGSYIAIKVVKPSSGSSYIYLDDIELAIPSSCVRPSDITFENYSDEGVDVSWTPSEGGEDLWNIQYKVATDTVWTQEDEIAEYPYTLSGLNANTVYQVRVQSNCYDEMSEWTEPVSFRTLCSAVTPEGLGTVGFEKIEGFETGSGKMTNCWTVGNLESTSTAYIPYVLSGVSTAHTDTNCLKLYAYKASSTNANGSYAIMPQMTFGGDGIASYQTQFYMRKVTAGNSYNDSLYVGIIADPSDPTSLQIVGHAVNKTTTYEKYTVTFSDYDGTDGRIVFLATAKDTSASYRYGQFYIDDVIVEPQPNCIEPENLEVDRITNAQAQISWIQGTETNWNLQYKAKSDTVWSAPIAVTTNPYTLTGLAGNTDYNVQMQAVCAPTDISKWSATASFTTLCDPVEPDSLGTISFETSEGFVTGAGKLAGCWQYGSYKKNVSTTYLPYVTSSTMAGYTHTGSNYLKIYSYLSSSTTADSTYAVMPPMTFADGITHYQTEFWMRKGSTSSYSSTSYADTLWVGIVSDLSDMSNLQIVGYAVSTTTTYEKYKVMFTNYTGGTDGYIVFLGAVDLNATAASNKYASFYIDDVVVEHQPSCIEPSDVVVNDFTDSQAEIAWTNGASETAWNIEYKATADTVWTAVAVTTNPYTLTGLAPKTTYNVRVQAACSATDLSKWSEVESFSTTAVPDNLPYITSFEDTLQDAGWSIVAGTTANKVFMIGNDSNAVATGARALYMSNEGVYGYNNSGAAKTYIYRTLRFTPGVYAVSFNWRCDGGESTYDWGRAMLVPATEQLVGGAGVMYSNTKFPNFIYTFDPAGKTFMNKTEGWNNYTGQIDMTDTAGIFNFVIMWNNDGSGGTQYPIAIDDISIVELSCAAPSNVKADTVADNRAVITWNQGLNESVWNLEYKASDDTVWTAVNGITAMTYTITGLTQNTDYDVRVQSVCTDEVTDWTQAISFRTSIVMPYSESFNVGTTAVDFPSLWKRYTGSLSGVMAGTTTLASTTSGWTIVATDNGLPANHIKNNVYGTARYQWLVSPAVYINNANAELAFDLALTKYNSTLSAVKTGLDDKFVVLVSTDNGATWSQNNVLREWYNDTVTAPEYAYNDIDSAGEAVALPLTAYYNQTIKVAFYIESTESNADNDLHLANVQIHQIPTCFKPTDITFDVATTEAEISWTPGRDETSWNMEYKADADTVWTAINNVTNPYTLTGLTTNTDYNVRLQSYCSEDDQSEWTRTYKFRTLCDVYTPAALDTVGFEVSEGFKTGAGNMANCWTVGNMQSTTTSYIPYVNSGTTYAKSGSACLRLYAVNTSTTKADSAYAVMPEINFVNGIANYELDFYMRKISTSTYSSYNDTLWVGLVTDPADMSTLQIIGNAVSTSTTYKRYSVSLSSATDGYLVFLAATDLNSTMTSKYAQFYVDNVTIEPACVAGVVYEQATICQGETYNWYGRVLTETGVYTDTVLHSATCDSIHELTLTVNPTYLIADTATIFDYQLPYIWRGQSLTEAGVYTDSLQTTFGCDSIYQLTLTVNPFVCVAPTNLVATLISNKSFQFDWVNPTLGTENEQANYFTYVLSATELDDPGAVKPTKAQRTTTMAQLTAALYNTEYHFYVKNVCNGVSSEWAHVAISSISGRPAVDSLYVIDTETQAISLSWKRNRFGKELKWKVDVALASDSSAVKSLVASTTNVRITGLDAETEYIFTVSPRLNSTNFGDPATVNGTTLDKPAMPVNVYGEITANRQLTFYWQNGSEADANNFSYKLSSKYIDMNKDKYSDNPDVEDFADTTVAFNSLSYGTTYYFYVRNVRATDGAASDWALCYVKTNLQNPPVKNIHAEETTPNSITVAWERGNAASAEPRWIVVMRRESDNQLIDSVNVNVLNATFTGLTRGTDYVARVYPRLNSTTLGTPASVVLSTEQTCEAPINLTYVNDAYRAYTFSWENPTIGTTEVEPNNFTYILVNSAEPINPDSTYPTKRNFTETTLSVAKLSKGATYYFYVRNEYDGAVSAWAGPIVFTVPASAPSAGAHYGDDEEEENVEIIAENVVPAEAYVNYDKLFVENIAEGSNVTVIDASGRVVFNAKVNDTRMEYDLYVRGVYMVVIRGKQEQTIKVVY